MLNRIVKTAFFIPILALALSFPANAGYKTALGKTVTVEKSEDGKTYTVTDKAGKAFTFKTCKKTMYVKSSDGLHLRKAPTTKGKAVRTLKWGTKVKVIGQAVGKANKWVLVRYRGKYRFLWGKYLTSKKPKKKYIGKFSITAYEYDGSRCANGRWPKKGRTVACNSLKLGTKVYIQGIGTRIVEDRGASWHSDNWMDIYLGSVSECNKWGVRTRKVWIVK